MEEVEIQQVEIYETSAENVTFPIKTYIRELFDRKLQNLYE